jgi:triphosphatase
MEIELKFQVPPAVAERVRRAVATRSASVSRLQAIYFETEDDRLSAAGLALRLRKEGRTWVQTLKGRGDGMMQRVEHEVRLPSRAGDPGLDLSRHDGTPVGAQLRESLGGGPAPQALYRTDIRRLHRVARHGAARIEIAFDQGWLLAGSDRVPVCEIEFELLAGTPAALVELARRWAERFELWWDVRTKAERGFRLARRRWQVPATRARASTLPVDAPLREAWAGMLQDALAHALPNAAELAGPYAAAEPPAGKRSAGAAPAARNTPQDGAPEHRAARPATDVDQVHQVRVALRRLRTVLLLFSAWGGDPDGAARLQRAWREPFHRLGTTRDADVMGGDIGPALLAAGAPALQPDAERDRSPGPGEIVRDPHFTALLLDTLAMVVAPVAPPAVDAAETDAPVAAPALKPMAAQVLQEAWRQVRRDLEVFSSLSIERQHRTRRRLKRLRYAWEFMRPLWSGAKARGWHKALARALDALGHYNDLCVAAEAFAARTEDDPGAWFACGWLAARRPVAMAEAARRLKALSELPRPWRHDAKAGKVARVVKAGRASKEAKADEAEGGVRGGPRLARAEDAGKAPEAFDPDA